jgi:hypothetical protein
MVDILGLPKHDASLPQKNGAPSILRVGCVAESCLCVERALELCLHVIAQFWYSHLCAVLVLLKMKHCFCAHVAVSQRTPLHRPLSDSDSVGKRGDFQKPRFGGRAGTSTVRMRKQHFAVQHVPTNGGLNDGVGKNRSAFETPKIEIGRHKTELNFLWATTRTNCYYHATPRQR